MLVLADEIRDDLLPRGSCVVVTRYPWTEMPKLRLTADNHQPAPPAWGEKGQSVVVMIVTSGRSARKVAWPALGRWVSPSSRTGLSRSWPSSARGPCSR